MKTWLLLHDMNENGLWLERISSQMSNLGRRVVSQKIIDSFTIDSCIKEGENLEGILCLFQGADSSASNNCRSILEPLLLAFKFVIEKGRWASVPRLCVATSGLWMECGSESNSSSGTAWGFVRSARMEVPWLTTKLVDLDPDVELEMRMEAVLKEIWMGTPAFGVCCNKSTFSGSIFIPTQYLLVVPGGHSFSEAVTLPAAFATAWHYLVDVAHASAKETVLIHAASGGVGLAAIKFAKHLGLDIGATAGSQRKRNFLRNLGVPYVYNSSTLEFGRAIKEVKNGQGVDIVLNCLTGPGLKETSLKVFKNGGPLVEISKLGILEERGVHIRKPGVNYKIVDMTVSESKLMSSLLESVSKMLTASFLKPLPDRGFTASRIISVLRFLHKAKQIGKVVVEMPQIDSNGKRLKMQLFNERSCYLITGANVASGLEIAEWMVENGAKYLALFGRSPPNQKALEKIQKLEEEGGAKIISIEADVADYKQIKRLIQEIQTEIKDVRNPCIM